jgi:hypothetical protein
VNETRAWTDEQVRRLVRLYLEGEMDAEELSVRIDGILIAAGEQHRGRLRPDDDEDLIIPRWVQREGR